MTDLPHLAGLLYGTPLLADERKLHEILPLFNRRLRGERIDDYDGPRALRWLEFWRGQFPLLAQMRSADRVRKCLLFGVDRTYRGHHETDAS